MKITNIHNLPAPFVQAVMNDPYNKVGDFSVTEVINPTRMIVLARQHEDELVEDASERVWSILGQAAHVILERAAPDNLVTENRLAMMWLKPRNDLLSLSLEEAKELTGTLENGFILSGQSDLVHNGILTDYKVTSVWTHVFGSRIEEWSKQLSLYRLLYHLHGIDIEKARIIEIFRDWQKSKAARDLSYPQSAVYEISIQLMSIEDTKKFLHDKLGELHYYLNHDEEPPACTPDERWQQPSKWAVYKSSRHKRAFRVVESREEALTIAEKLEGAIIKERPSTPVRCLSYCPVAQFCSFYHSIKEEEGGG